MILLLRWRRSENRKELFGISVDIGLFILSMFALKVSFRRRMDDHWDGSVIFF
jgi:hypothetical protein